MSKIITREYDLTTAGRAQYANFTVVIPGPIAENGKLDVFDDNGVYECSNITAFKENIGKVPPQDTAIAPIFSARHAFTLEEFNAYQPYVYRCIENKFPKIGKLKDAEYVYVHVTDPDAYIEGKMYAVIENGNEGTDVSSYGNQMAYELIDRGYTVYYKLVDDTTEYGTGKKTGYEALTTEEYWEALKDRTAYDFRYITTGGYYDKEAYKQIAKLAAFKNADYILNPNNNLSDTGRGDCCALIDLIETEEMKNRVSSTQIKAVQTAINELDFGGNTADDNGKFTAIFAPKVIYDRIADVDYKNNEMPATFHYLACAGEARVNYAEWYAVAGYTRGQCSLRIAGTSIAFGELAVNALAPRFSGVTKQGDIDVQNLNCAINLITKDHGNYYIWGNRTASKLDTTTMDEPGLRASHFLNIRQLCTTIKKEIYTACRSLTFDPNSDLLWFKFINKMQPVLDNMRADQGIDNYAWVREEVSAKALTKAKLRIVPIEAVEDFDIGITLENSISGVIATVDDNM